MRTLLLITACSTLLASCNSRPKLVEALTQQTDSVSSPIMSSTDSTTYGQCTFGTSLDTLKLLSDEGDTLTLNISGQDSLLLGGINDGDKLAVLLTADYSGERRLRQSVNLTTLSGLWHSNTADSTASPHTLYIHEKGNVNTAALPNGIAYQNWVMHNGKIIFSGENTRTQSAHADTFSIGKLTADTLKLVAPSHTWILCR